MVIVCFACIIICVMYLIKLDDVKFEFQMLHRRFGFIDLPGNTSYDEIVYSFSYWHVRETIDLMREQLSNKMHEEIVEWSRRYGYRGLSNASTNYDFEEYVKRTGNETRELIYLVLRARHLRAKN